MFLLGPISTNGCWRTKIITISESTTPVTSMFRTISQACREYLEWSSELEMYCHRYDCSSLSVGRASINILILWCRGRNGCISFEFRHDRRLLLQHFSLVSFIFLPFFSILTLWPYVTVQVPVYRDTVLTLSLKVCEQNSKAYSKSFLPLQSFYLPPRGRATSFMIVCPSN
jgi:hypothetical protein